MFFRIIRSVLLFRIRNCKCSSMAISPLRILIILAFWSFGSSFYRKTENKQNNLSIKSELLIQTHKEKLKAPNKHYSGQSRELTVSVGFPAGELPALSSVSIASLQHTKKTLVNVKINSLQIFKVLNYLIYRCSLKWTNFLGSILNILKLNYLNLCTGNLFPTLNWKFW